MAQNKEMSVFDLLHHTKNLDQITLKLWSGVPKEFDGYFVHDEEVTLFSNDIVFGNEFDDFQDYFKNIYPIKYTFYVDGLHSFCLYIEDYLNMNK